MLINAYFDVLVCLGVSWVLRLTDMVAPESASGSGSGLYTVMVDA